MSEQQQVPSEDGYYWARHVWFRAPGGEVRRFANSEWEIVYLCDGDVWSVGREEESEPGQFEWLPVPIPSLIPYPETRGGGHRTDFMPSAKATQTVADALKSGDEGTAPSR